MALVALTHNKFECLKYLIQEPPLVYEGSIGQRLLLRRSRKCLPLSSDAWNIIFHCFSILSHSLFLSKPQDDLHSNNGVRLNSLDSLLTIEWRSHLLSLRQSQKMIEFEGSLLKNSLSSFNIAIDWSWWIKDAMCCINGVCDDNDVSNS